MEKRFNPLNASSFKPVTREFVRRKRHPFNDKRIHAVWSNLVERIEGKVSGVIRQLASDRAESEQFYRFLSNEKIDMGELIQMSCKINAQISDRHLLVVSDSSSINLKNHVGRIQNLDKIGVLEDNKTPGFMCHASVCIDAKSENVLGLCDTLLWNRPKSEGPKAICYKLKAEDKESYKWTLGIDNSTKVLAAARMRTFVLDSDADNYDLFSTIGNTVDNNFVIRAKHDRTVSYEGEKQTISQSLEKSPVLGTYTLKVPPLDHYSFTNSKRIKRKAREATIELRAIPIQMLPPKTTDHPGGEPFEMYVVEARELNYTGPEDEGPILWRLLTSHPVLSFEQAQEIVQYYCLRWVIEQLFRTIKKEGFNIEGTELETIEAIQRQTILVLRSAARVLQLVYARDKIDAQPIEEVFDEEEQETLELLNRKYEGKTEKLKNHYPRQKLSWASWIIARMGGWKGSLSERPPGPITMKRGLEKFDNIVEALRMIRGVDK